VSEGAWERGSVNAWVRRRVGAWERRRVGAWTRVCMRVCNHLTHDPAEA